MFPNTTRTGISAIDKTFGGVYLRRPTIIYGPRKSGKFIFAKQLIAKTLLSGEKIVLFTSKRPEEVVAGTRLNNLDVDAAVESGQFVICPYSSMDREGTGPYAPLPFPQALDELVHLVHEHSISYAVFDTVVPWTAIEPVEMMPDHVDNFVSTLETLGLTSLLILPEAASAAALSLTTVLRELCPINLELESRNYGSEFRISVTKFQGFSSGSGTADIKFPAVFALDLIPGVGFVEPPQKTPQKEAASDAAAHGKKSQPPAQTFRPFLAPGLADFAKDAPAPKSAHPVNPAAEVPAAAAVAARQAYTAFISTAPSLDRPAFDVSALTSAPPVPPVPPPAAPKAPRSATPFASVSPTTSFASVASPAASFASAAPPAASFASAPPPPPAAQAAPPPPPAPPADANPPAQRHISFANVVDLPEFPNAQPDPSPPSPAQQPPQRPRGFSFSQAIK